jgi:hypothetical protein
LAQEPELLAREWPTVQVMALAQRGEMARVAAATAEDWAASNLQPTDD